jgi:oligopeptide transport system ATP-binding protein
MMTVENPTAPLLAVEDLSVRFTTPDGTVRAVNEVSFTIEPGETVGIVGESGSGKSQLFLSILGLLAANGRAEGGVRFRGRQILGLPVRELNHIRGSRIAMIFQDPMTSLNPYLTVATQMTEVLRLHKGMSNRDARRHAIDLLDRVRIPEAARRIDRYPHEFSGGMRQRVMIAMALLCRPDLLIADEPTTALDVTIQAQILDLMSDLKRDFATAILLITHDLGVVAQFCDEVAVMYAGRIVEEAPVEALFARPRHPYTAGLLAATPRLDGGRGRLPTIAGTVPPPGARPTGCAFAPRCPRRLPACIGSRPGTLADGPARRLACWNPVP